MDGLIDLGLLKYTSKKNPSGPDLAKNLLTFLIY